MKKLKLEILEELREHVPFTALATLCSIILVGFLLIKQNLMVYAISSFEILHPAHILFSSLVSTAIFYNYKRKILHSVIFGSLIALFVGSISDVIFPYIGGLIFNLPISFHLPVFEEPLMILGVALIGSVSGIFFKKTKFPHFLHVLISVFASLLYIFAYSANFSLISLISIFIITSISVVIPCCLSDIVLPILFQNKFHKKKESSPMKTLKFRKKLAEQILKGKKTTTWRLFDDKALSKGDNLSLIIWETGKEFARAKIKEVIEKKMGELTKEDFEGHEKIESKKEMYNLYTKYYHKPVGPETKIKIVKFELIK